MIFEILWTKFSSDIFVKLERTNYWNSCKSCKLIFFYREIKFGVYLFLITHWFACGWFMVACPNVNMLDLDLTGSTNASLNDIIRGTCTNNSWIFQDGRDTGKI